MKKILERVLAILFVFFCILCLLPCNEAKAAGTANDIVSVAKNEVGNSGVPNKYTRDLGSIGGSYSYAWCHAFVSWCAKNAGCANLVPRTASCAQGVQWFDNRGEWKDRSSGYTPQIGDIIYFDYGANGTYDHVGIVTGTGNGRVYTIEGNARNQVKVNGGYSNGYALNSSDILGYGTPAYPSRVTGHSPDGSCAIEGRTGGVYVRGWTLDKDSKSTPLNVHVYIGGPAGVGEGHPGIIANAYRPDVPISLADAALGDYHGLDVFVPTSKSGPQDIYVYAINVGEGDHSLIGQARINIGKDSVAPDIMDIRIDNATADGYTVSCKVTDDVMVDHVVFSTWSEKNGQDDKVEQDGYRSGDIFTYQVKRSAHNNEYGIYITHIFAYDSAGNCKLVSAGSTLVGGYDPEGSCAIEGKIGGVYVRGWAIDRDSESTPLNVHVYIGGPAGVGEGCPGIIADAYRPDVPISLADAALGDYHGLDVFVPTSKIGKQDVYVYGINIGNGDHALLGKATVNIEKDTILPNITDINISDITTEGYTVSCKVVDNISVDRVVFSTWTDNGGKDDQVEEDGVRAGDIYTYQVKRSAHKNECGTYTTHIFAYDPAGNYALTSAGSTTIKHYEMEDAAVKATCTTEGKTAGSHCSVCGAIVKKQDILPMSGHSGNKITKGQRPATSFEEGYTGDIYCQDCGELLQKGEVIPVEKQVIHVEDISLDKSSVHFSDIGESDILTATITPFDADNTSVIWKSSDMNVVSVNDSGEITALDQGTAEIMAMTEEGNKVAVCIVTVQSQEACKHDYECSVVEEASCTGNGTAQYICKICGAPYIVELPQLVHIWEEQEMLEPATCTDPGQQIFICNLCGESQINDIPAKGHQNTELINDKEATCAEDGYTGDICCVDCQAIVSSGQIIGKTEDHLWDKGEIIKEATKTEEGIKNFTCSVCGENKTEIIPETGFSDDDFPGEKELQFPVIKKRSIDMYEGGKPQNLKVTNTVGKVTYKSNAPEVVRVDPNNGKMIPVSGGRAVITINVSGDELYQAATLTVDVTVHSKVGLVKKVKAVPAKTRHTMKISWKKMSSVSYYQVQYAYKKNMKGAKTLKKETAAMTVKKLSSKKYVYVRVRACVTKGGVTSYGKWSSVIKSKGKIK